MQRIPTAEIPAELLERVSSVLVPGEVLSDITFASDGSVTLAYKEIASGIQVLGCSDCIGVVDPPSIPISAITVDETRFSAAEGARLCRSCHRRLWPSTP